MSWGTGAKKELRSVIFLTVAVAVQIIILQCLQSHMAMILAAWKCANRPADVSNMLVRDFLLLVYYVKDSCCSENIILRFIHIGQAKHGVLEQCNLQACKARHLNLSHHRCTGLEKMCFISWYIFRPNANVGKHSIISCLRREDFLENKDPPVSFPVLATPTEPKQNQVLTEFQM